jgi:hypothetical protein
LIKRNRVARACRGSSASDTSATDISATTARIAVRTFRRATAKCGCQRTLAGER